MWLTQPSLPLCSQRLTRTLIHYSMTSSVVKRRPTLQETLWPYWIDSSSSSTFLPPWGNVSWSLCHRRALPAYKLQLWYTVKVENLVVKISMIARRNVNVCRWIQFEKLSRNTSPVPIRKNHWNSLEGAYNQQVFISNAMKTPKHFLAMKTPTANWIYH